MSVNRTPLTALIALGLMMFAAPAAQADPGDSWATTEYNYARDTLDDFTDNFARGLVDPVARGVRQNAPQNAARPQQGARPGAVAAAITFAPARAPGGQTVAGRMAMRYPAATRAQVEAHFNAMLRGYRDVEAQLGLPRNDVASGVASFIVGNWMAMNNASFPDEHYKPLVLQLRAILAASPEFAALTNTQRQDIYEQMAITGMMMATTQMALKTRPDPETERRMRAQGRANLEQWLGTDPNTVRLTPRGLEIGR